MLALPAFMPSHIYRIFANLNQQTPYLPPCVLAGHPLLRLLPAPSRAPSARPRLLPQVSSRRCTAGKLQRFPTYLAALHAVRGTS